MKIGTRFLSRLPTVSVAIVIAFASATQAAWSPVPAMDWSSVEPADFDDAELDVPFYLQHFAQVANGVVESGPTRGFLDIKVNRDPKDNQPYNARILEMNTALAYFYASKRPWNPYFGSEPVRVRLEAMLEFWCKSQNAETGLFSEYSPDNFSLAPTGFGVLHMSRTLELLSADGAPAFDAEILKRTFAAQRKAILAMLTRDDIFKWGSTYSNQWSGVLRAATSYLSLKLDDKEMRAALMPAIERTRTFQSPTGFLYEANGPDVAYSTVHENNLRFGWAQIEKFPGVKRAVLAEDVEWNRFLSYQLLRQPGTMDFFANSGVNSRTSASIQEPRLRATAAENPSARFIAITDDEYAKDAAKKRAELEATWPKFKSLPVPSSNGYGTAVFFNAHSDYRPKLPTSEQREESIAKLPYLREQRFSRVAADPARNSSFVMVKRPTYYATFNHGKGHERQNFGLGVVWNPKAGIVIQPVSGTRWQLGTIKGGTDSEPTVHERGTVAATLLSGSNPFKSPAGYHDIGPGNVTASYATSDGGKKSVRFEEGAIVIDAERAGTFTELLPLVTMLGDQTAVSGQTFTLTRGETKFIVSCESTEAKLTLGSPELVRKDDEQYARRALRIEGAGRLRIKLSFITGE